MLRGNVWRWMRRAYEVSRRSNCVRRSVGAVLVRDNIELISGSNGVDRTFESCLSAGCPRCATGGVVGIGYELCICVHAGQDAITRAARDGIAIGNATAYVTLRPCLTCLTLMINSGIKRVFYCEDWSFTPESEVVYQLIAKQMTEFERVPISSEGLAPE